MTDEGTVFVPAYPVTAVDTVGAGDAFNGALAVALAEGRSLLEAAVWASDAAALAVTRARRPGWPAVPRHNRSPGRHPPRPTSTLRRV